MLRILPAITALVAVHVHAATFFVEDEALVAPPTSAVMAVSRASDGIPTGYDGEPCKLVGKVVSLRFEEAEPLDWIATTDDSCAWAASAAPIWVIRRIGPEYHVVLSDVAYDLTLGSGTQNGLRHIVTSRATAAQSQSRFWKFDGVKYKPTYGEVAEI